ncbi:hypothetical protein PFISCL1PPCAC_819, partial [Pristionchus fissidentatus]
QPPISTNQMAIGFCSAPESEDTHDLGECMTLFNQWTKFGSCEQEINDSLMEATTPCTDDHQPVQSDTFLLIETHNLSSILDSPNLMPALDAIEMDHPNSPVPTVSLHSIGDAVSPGSIRSEDGVRPVTSSTSIVSVDASEVSSSSSMDSLFMAPSHRLPNPLVPVPSLSNLIVRYSPHHRSIRSSSSHSLNSDQFSSDLITRPGDHSDPISARSPNPISSPIDSWVVDCDSDTSSSSSYLTTSESDLTSDSDQTSI